MSASQQIEHNDATGPNIGLLSICKDICNLFRWFIQERAAFREISDRVKTVLDGKTKVNELDSAYILMTAKDYIVRLNISMNNILIIVQVGKGFEEAAHNFGANLLRKTHLACPHLMLF